MKKARLECVTQLATGSVAGVKIVVGHLVFGALVSAALSITAVMAILAFVAAKLRVFE